MDSNEGNAAPPPNFGARRLLLIGTGAVGVAFLPFWLHWLRTAYPDLDTRVLVTRSAERFVTRTALTVYGGRAVSSDEWPSEPEVGARHVELAEWADAVAVYPCTLHFLARLALGLADTPAMLALQCTRAPVALAMSLPPGGWDSAATTAHRRALSERANVLVVPPRPGVSLTTGRDDGLLAVSLPALLRRLEELRRRLDAPGEA